MKFLKATLLCLLLSSAVFADGYWPKSYFVEAGFGMTYTRGDLHQGTISAHDTLEHKITVHPPKMDFIPTPSFTLGANIRDFTLGLNFQYWSTSGELTKAPDNADESDIRIWRLGFEFTYNLFWPDEYQIGLGGGYSFTNINTRESAFFGDEVFASELYGSGVGFVANAHYYFMRHLAIVPAVKIYENWFKNVYTSRTETCDLDPYLWQTYFMASVSLQYQF